MMSDIPQGMTYVAEQIEGWSLNPGYLTLKRWKQRWDQGRPLKRSSPGGESMGKCTAKDSKSITTEGLASRIEC